MIEILTNTYTRWDPGPATTAIELDMGCGKGGFLLQLAERFPQRVIVGSDIMMGRLRRLARKTQQRGLANVRLLRAESLQLASFQLPPNSIQRVHVLCPDPWPKARHRCRRLFTTDFFTRLSRVLTPDGTLHVATDHLPYWQVLENMLAQLDFFAPAPERLADLAGLETDFERQWRAQGKHVPHATYRLLATLPHAGRSAAEPALALDCSQFDGS